MNPNDPNQLPAVPGWPPAPEPTSQPLPQPIAPTPAAEPEPAQPPVKEKHAIHNPLNVMQAGERVICEIKRHPIGIFGVYAGAGLMLVVAAILAFVVAPLVFTDNSRSSVMAVGGLIFFVAALITVGFVFVAQKVYWGNSWVVTTDSITQITQVSLFSKRSSQLSLGNLEDITAEQNGPLAHMFNFGVLRAETAGERSKFMLLYCPNPNEYARQILAAREQFEQGRRSTDDQRLYRSENSYSAPAAPMSEQVAYVPSTVPVSAPQIAQAPLPPTPSNVATYEVPTADDNNQQPPAFS